MSREAETRAVIIDYCRKLYRCGFLPGIDGNISMRASEDTVVITPSGVCKGIVEADELVTVTLNGDVVTGCKKPSCETPMHLAAYIHQPEVNAVVHAHSPNIIAYSMAGRHFDMRYAPFTYEHIGKVHHAAFGAPGSKSLHDDVTAAIRQGYKAIVLKNHGSMLLGKDMLDAFVNTDLLEAYAGMLIKAEVLGGAQMLTKEELDSMPCGFKAQG